MLGNMNVFMAVLGIKTFILPSIICLRLWCGVFPRLP
ncbi:hypothetical protein [Pseudomonas aeruginosa]